MPFTLAHPVVVLPLHTRWRAGFLALVLGSVGPDIPYFLPARLGQSMPTSHTFWGALSVGTPLSLALMFLVVSARGVLVAPLWGALQQATARALEAVRTSPISWLHAVPAAALGCEIHVLWDSFTHRNGWMVLRWPLLSSRIPLLAGYSIEVYRLLQYLCSVAGLALIIWWSARRLRPLAARAGPPRSWQPGALLALAAVAGAVAWRATRHAGPRFASFHGQEYVFLTNALSTFAVLYVLLGAVLSWRARRPIRESQAPI